RIVSEAGVGSQQHKEIRKSVHRNSPKCAVRTCPGLLKAAPITAADNCSVQQVRNTKPSGIDEDIGGTCLGLSLNENAMLPHLLEWRGHQFYVRTRQCRIEIAGDEDSFAT